MLKPWRLHGCVATTRHFIFFIFYQRHKVKEYSFRLYSAGRHGRQSGSRGRSYRPRPKNTHAHTHLYPPAAAARSAVHPVWCVFPGTRADW